jgi:membrane protein
MALQRVRAMFRAFAIPITWSELVKRTVRETNEDDCLGLAAQLAYYFVLSLVPALVFMLALTSLFPSQLLQNILRTIQTVAPSEVAAIVTMQMREIAGGNNGGVLTFGVGMALWSSSSAMVAITSALNRAYDIEEGRPWWKVRLTAIGLTVALAAFILTAFALVVAGPLLGGAIASRVGLGAGFDLAWTILRWPFALALVVLAIAFINYFAPDAEQDWEWVTPGAVLATLLWLLASLCFKVYVSQFADYNATYGSLGGVIVLLLWLYISSLAILVGAEMNAEIEHASPHGKDPGEKVPGQRRKLGAAAARAYEERLRRDGDRGAGERFVPPAPAAGSRSYVPGLATFVATWLFRRRRVR